MNLKVKILGIEVSTFINFGNPRSKMTKQLRRRCNPNLQELVQLDICVQDFLVNPCERTLEPLDNHKCNLMGKYDLTEPQMDNVYNLWFTEHYKGGRIV